MSTKQEPIIAKATELAHGATVLARAGDRIYAELEGQIFTPSFDVLLVRKDHIIVRERDNKDARKLQLPLAWGKDGHVQPTLSEHPLHLYAVVGDTPTLALAKAKKAGPRRGEGPTKMDRCREIFKANPTADKATLIKMFVEEAKCTPAGANTYHNTLKKGA